MSELFGIMEGIFWGYKDLLKKLWEILSQNEAILLGFVLGIVGFIIKYFKDKISNFIASLTERFIYRVTIEDKTDMFEAISEWYYKNHPEDFNNVEARLDEHWENEKPHWELKYYQINYKKEIIHNGKKIKFSKVREKNEGKDSTKKYNDIYYLSAFRGKEAVTDLLVKIVDQWNDKNKEVKGLKVILKGKYHDNKTKYKRVYKTFDNLFFDGKEELIKDINTYLERVPWYEEKRIRCKRSYLFTGPAGTGKTETAFAIASHCKRRIYFVNPKTFVGDQEFEAYISSIKPQSVMIMEDVDSLLPKRDEPETILGKVGFSSVLNCLDGLFSPEDVIIIMTTNRPEVLDEALLRKGRLDYKLEIGFPTREKVQQYLDHFYETSGITIKNDYEPKVPMVDIQDICLSSSGLKETLSKINTI